MKKDFLNLIKIILLSIILGVGVGLLSAAWNNPTSTPPGGNVAAPINTGPTPQSKGGSVISSLLDVNGTLSAQSLAVFGNATVTGTVQTTNFVGSTGNRPICANTSKTATLCSGGTNYNLTINKTGTGASIGTVTPSPSGTSCGSGCYSYSSGTPVTLQAQAGTNNTFTGWSGGCSGTNTTCVVTINAATTVTANFTSSVPTYSVTISKGGSGTGVVSSAPSGVNCGSTCQYSFNQGTPVVLTATPTTGTFSGWSGGGCSGTSTCTVSSAATVTATFTPATVYSLTISKSGAGTGTVTSSIGGINCGTACSASYNSGTSVTLTATASTGVFAGWSGACSGTSTTCLVAMSAAKSVTAAFATVPTVTTGTSVTNVTNTTATINNNNVAADNGAAVTARGIQYNHINGPVSQNTAPNGSTGTGTYSQVLTGLTPGTVYQYRAYANNAAGSGYGNTVSGGFVTTNNYTLTVSKTGMGAAQGTVTSSPSGINCGSTCSANFIYNANVSLTPTATGTAIFSGWSGCDSVVNGITCVVAMSATKSVTANFTATSAYTLTVSKGGSGLGTVTSSPSGINCGSTCSANFGQGSSITLTAAAASPSTFGGWSGGGCSGTSTTCTIIMSTSATTVTATFTAPTCQGYSSGGYCWHMAASPSQTGLSCTQVCQSYGGCNTANWNDDASCSVLHHFGKASGCATGAWYDYGLPGSWYYNNDSRRRADSATQDCNASISYINRLCACLY